MPSAYLLVSHGSHDPRPQVAMEHLAALISQFKAPVENEVRRKEEEGSRMNWDRGFNPTQMMTEFMQGRESLVGTACLELSPEPLHEQIKEFGDRVASRNENRAVGFGCNRIQVVPLFLLAGVHVMEDIPAEVAKARQALGELKIDLRPHLGTHPGLSRLLATQMAGKADAWILLAHGSRRPGSKQPVEAIARQLGSQAAYWAVAPRLESRVKELVAAGHRHIGILPYFLFAGGITDAIAQSVEQLKVQFPGVLLELAEPIGASAQLADLIWDLMEK